MAGIHLLDRVIGSEYPNFATDADVRAFEQIPYRRPHRRGEHL